MSRVLRSYDYSVAAATSVGEALSVLESGEFDLLLSDLGLPDGTGWDLMRQISTKRSIKAIAVSGYGTEDDLRNSREAGFQAHLTKPLDLAKLDEAIRQLCA